MENVSDGTVNVASMAILARWLVPPLSLSGSGLLTGRTDGCVRGQRMSLIVKHPMEPGRNFGIYLICRVNLLNTRSVACTQFLTGVG